MLILSNEEIESFLSIKTCIDALEKAYKSWDKGTAINRPRTDLVLPLPGESGVYAFKSMEAGLVDPPIVAMRINSDIIRWRQQGGRVLKTKIPAASGDKYVGLVMLPLDNHAMQIYYFTQWCYGAMPWLFFTPANSSFLGY